MAGRVRRRRVVDRRHDEVTPERRTAMALATECMRARLARIADEENARLGRVVFEVDPAHRRSDEWWLTTPDLDPLTRYRELCARGVWRWEDTRRHQVPVEAA